MVSLQPTNQSYFADEESCFLVPQVKPYRKGSLMSILMMHSPIFAFLCQHSALDTLLDSEDFQGTVFAPGKEYCARYYSFFTPSTIDHQRAREIVLSSTLRAPMYQKDLYAEPGNDVPFVGCQTAVLPTMHRYSMLHVQVDAQQERLRINSPNGINGEHCPGGMTGGCPGNALVILRGDLTCTNGVLHLLNGMIEPEARV